MEFARAGDAGARPTCFLNTEVTPTMAGQAPFAERKSERRQEVVVGVSPSDKALGVKGRGSQVWQTKELREGVSGSVAMIRLRGAFCGCVANKGLSGGWNSLPS